MKHYEAMIIGFGKGGKTLAAHLGAQGKQTVLIEKSRQMYGGTCINVGCIPSKSLIHSAAAAAAHPEEGWEEKSRRYEAAIAEKRRLTGMLRGKNHDKLENDPNVTVLDGKAAFLGPKTVQVETADGVETITAEQVFVNTGSVSVVPDIAGIEGNPRVYYSDGLMELDALPRQLVIIGGGYIGLEFASMYANFGAKVTVVQHGEKFLPREDGDIADAVRGLLEEQGVVFRLGAQIQSVEEDGTVRYQWNGEAFAPQADAVLLATGRRPNTEGLNLAAAGIDVTARGAVAVDKLLRTSAPDVWAMGDVTGGQQFTYTSLDDYRVVASQLDGRAEYTVAQRRNVPYSVFMATPLSRVGLNEREAREAGYDVRVAKLNAAAIPKAQVLKRPGGLLKAVVDNATEKILGVMLLCQESYETINVVKLAMDLGADYTVLRDQVFTHPTMTEALNDLFALV